MAAPSYTYTLTNGTTADASQVQQNFTDILNGVTDGTKDLSILGLTVAASAVIGDNTTLGSSSGDDVTWNASLASSVPVKTTASYNVGDSTHGLLSIYFGRNSQSVRVIASASMSATWTLTLPVAAGTANFAMITDGSGTTSWSSWTNSAWYADGSNAGTLSATTQTIGGAKTFSAAATFSSGIVLGNETLTIYDEASYTSTFTFNGASGGTTGSATIYCTRIGRKVTLSGGTATVNVGTGTNTALSSNTNVTAGFRPTAQISFIGIPIQNNGGDQTASGSLTITSGGALIFNRDWAGTAWTNSAVGGVDGAWNVTFTIN